jgi:DNA polymerase I-like protein with 3'-5' exonuclease and polymerase domains
MKLVIDIESNSLMELTLDAKGNPVKEATVVHCVVTKDIDTGAVRVFTGKDIGEPLRTHLSAAEWLIGHNLYGFDLECLMRLCKVPLHQKIFDSLVVSKLMYPDRMNHPLGGNSLKDWGKKLGNEKISFDGPWTELTQEMIDYCIQDVHVAHEIYEYQTKWIEDNNYHKVVKLEHMASEIIMRQQSNGFSFDIDAAMKLQNDLLQTKSSIEDEMRSIFPDKVHQRISEKTGKRLKDKIEVFNPGSRQQIAERLFDKYGWVAPLTEAGNANVDADVLGELNYPEAKKLVEYFDIQKLMGQVSDWITRSTNSRDGNVHGFVNVQGAATGRCTHSQPNLAQVHSDHRARELWIPGDGEVMLGSDLSGLELRMLAHYMHEYDKGAYADVILNGDIHTHNQIKAGLPDRNTAKTFIYGFLYGAGDAKVGKIVDGSAKHGAALKSRFLKELPALAKVKDWVEFCVLSENSLTLVDGRKVPIRSKHAALNTLLQGSGAVVSKYWMILANYRLRKAFGEQVKQVAYVHDELQFSCPAKIADQAGKIITDAAIEAGNRLGIRMPINAEYKIGRNWAETH